MAITRNNLSMKMNGRVGAYTFYTTSGGRQVARIANNGSNYGESAKRTVAMQTRRTKWGNLVSFYRANRDLMARAFERKDANISDYNRYMQLNIPLASVALTKDDFLRGMVVVQEYVVADGSLPEIGCSLIEEEGCVFDLLTSLENEFADYTIGQVSADLMDNNPQLQEGDQITFVNWTNASTAGGPLRIYRHLCEVTIDSQSSVSFSTLKYANIVAGFNGKVIIQGQGQVFGQTVIHSRSVAGRLLTSHAQITLFSTTFVEQFSSADAVKKAIASYGVDVEKLLEPGSDEQPAPRPLEKLATISSKTIPDGCATITIVDNVTGEQFRDSASLPIGSMVAIRYEATPGYDITMRPDLEDPENYEVYGDAEFLFIGTPIE